METPSVGIVRAERGVLFQELEASNFRRSIWRITSVRGLGVVFGAILFLGFFTGAAKAQDVASITGTVTDKNEEAVFDADVRLADTRTGAVYESKTGSYGAYLFARVPAGKGYTLTVSKDGFKTVSISKLVLAVTETATYDVKLELGSISQTVEVSANSGGALNTTDATIGNDIDT